MDDDIFNFGTKRPREDDADDAFVAGVPRRNDDYEYLGEEAAAAPALTSTTLMAVDQPPAFSRMPTFETGPQPARASAPPPAASFHPVVLPPPLPLLPPVATSTMPAIAAPPALQPSAATMPEEDAKVPAIEAPPPLVDNNAATTMFVERWTCDKCRIQSFDTFEEAHAHEAQCKAFAHQAVSEAAGVLTALALCPPAAANEEDDDEESVDSDATPMATDDRPKSLRHALNLVPSDDAIMSDYNNLLVRHCEFFYPSSDNRVGLRCIHCKDSGAAGATFFPSTIASLSSGLGTIGARHFGWGKCPSVPAGVKARMAATKKTSGIQTKDRTRIGLDVYAKNLAKKYGLFNDERSGVCWIEGTAPNNSLSTDQLLTKKTSRSSRGSSKAVAASSNAGAGLFVPSGTLNFWECHGCKSVPFDFRSQGSVVYSVGEPPLAKIEGHLTTCTGGKPLAIPHSASIEPFYGEGVPSIKVKWDGKQARRSSGRTRRSQDAKTVKTGLEDFPLCVQDDQQFTTDFAFFVTLQLKCCYLTGKRASAPLGFPGLACMHCAGSENPRRFFYTSADHLRNSFSHIPSHLAECDACPAEVKARIEELKQTRNSQKSLLKPGSHKIFIDRVWARLGHTNDDDTEDEEEGLPSTALVATRQATRAATALVLDEDKANLTDLTHFVLLQAEGYKTLGGSMVVEGAGAEDDSREIIGFPGLVCKHCSKTSGGRKFFTTSSEHLGDLLLTIADHLQLCKECPSSVKAQIKSCKMTHEAELKQLSGDDGTGNSHDACLEKVWRRLIVLNQQDEKQPSVAASKPKPAAAPTQHKTVDPSVPLVTANEESLVTPYTYLTMKQVQGCNLDNYGNGTRSTFDFGFPGLACRHCAGSENPRRFFYRTSEILSGNYSHIPNHLLACPGVPAEMKKQLKKLKQDHLRTKHALNRGAQKLFFQTIWDRLHQK